MKHQNSNGFHIWISAHSLTCCACVFINGKLLGGPNLHEIKSKSCSKLKQTWKLAMFFHWNHMNAHLIKCNQGKVWCMHKFLIWKYTFIQFTSVCPLFVRCMFFEEYFRLRWTCACHFTIFGVKIWIWCKWMPCYSQLNRMQLPICFEESQLFIYSSKPKPTTKLTNEKNTHQFIDLAWE